jgi:hypothetical protein
VARVGHLGARLHEAEDVVDEEEDVLALLAEVLGHREARETDAEARTRWLVHLPVDEGHLVDDARLVHLEPEVVAFARPLPHAREHRDAAVLEGDVVDELLDEHGLADTGPAEEADLAALDVRGDEVDDLDPRLEDLHLRGEVTEVRRVAVDRPALRAFRRRALLVDRVAGHVPEPSERRGADRDGDGRTGVDAHGAAGEPVRRVHGNRADTIVSEVLLHLGDQRADGASLVGELDAERGVDLGQAVRKDGVDDDALDLDDPAGVRAV